MYQLSININLPTSFGNKDVMLCNPITITADQPIRPFHSHSYKKQSNCSLETLKLTDRDRVLTMCVLTKPISSFTSTTSSHIYENKIKCVATIIIRSRQTRWRDWTLLTYPTFFPFFSFVIIRSKNAMTDWVQPARANTTARGPFNGFHRKFSVKNLKFLGEPCGHKCGFLLTVVELFLFLITHAGGATGYLLIFISLFKYDNHFMFIYLCILL